MLFRKKQTNFGLFQRVKGTKLHNVTGSTETLPVFKCLTALLLYSHLITGLKLTSKKLKPNSKKKKIFKLI